MMSFLPQLMDFVFCESSRHLAVLQLYDPVGDSHRLRIMGDHDDRLAVLLMHPS